MSRQTGVLAALGVVLLAALFYFFVWQPKSEEIAGIEEEIEAVEQQQAQLRQRITELKEVRANAPDAESDIVAAESIVPRDIGQAAAIRQLQLAADESGVELPTVSFGPPAQVQDATPGLAAIQVTVALQGGYYQIVDFYRRVEDPAITPRGFTWNNISVSPSEYPTLSASSSGSMYALLPTPPQEAPDDEPVDEGDDTDDAEVVEEDAG